VPGRLAVARRFAPVAFFGIALALSALARADIVVLAGSEASLDDGVVDAGCTDVVVGGTLHTGTSRLVNVRHVVIQPGGVIDGVASHIELGGEWTNQGSFVPGQGSVAFVDACGLGPATIGGETTFHDLSFTSAIGKIWRLPAGATQTVRGSLNARGIIGTTTLASTLPGEWAFIRPLGAVIFSEIELAFVRLLLPGVQHPVPALGTLGVALLSCLLLLAMQVRRTRRPSAVRMRNRPG